MELGLCERNNWRSEYLTIGITATRGARPDVRARPVSGRVRTR